jgi:hypothetical protein
MDAPLIHLKNRIIPVVGVKVQFLNTPLIYLKGRILVIRLLDNKK